MSTHTRVYRQRVNSPYDDRHQESKNRALDRNHLGDRDRSADAGLLRLQQVVGNKTLSRMLIKPGTTPKNVVQRNPITDRLTTYINTGSNGAIRTLAQHLLTIIGHIDSGNFSAAYDLLQSNAVARSIQYSINTKFKQIDGTNHRKWGEVLKEAEETAKQGMHFKGKLLLPDVMVMVDDDITHAKTPQNDPTLANVMLPVMLEEWIHAFQTAIGGYLSEGTELFGQTADVVTNQQQPAGTMGRYDLKEVDIYAIYRDLGWNNVLDAFRSRYAERGLYEEHAKKVDELTATFARQRTQRAGRK